jgi:hypothetical protein
MNAEVIGRASPALGQRALKFHRWSGKFRAFRGPLKPDFQSSNHDIWRPKAIVATSERDLS